MKVEVKGEDGEDEEMSLIEMSVPPKRPYRKKTTEEKKRKERRLAVTSVLAEKCKVTYRDWHRAHCKAAPLKGAAHCEGSGWGAMLQNLLNKDLPKCSTCLKLLSSRGVHEASLDKFFGMVDSFEKLTLIQNENKIPDDEGAAENGQELMSMDVETAGNSSDLAAVDADEDDQDDPAHGADRKRRKTTKPVDVCAMVRGLTPTLDLLEPGLHGKRLPVRCNICKRSRRGEVIFDIINGRSPGLLLQHLRSAGHVRAMSDQKQKNGQNARKLENQEGANNDGPGGGDDGDGPGGSGGHRDDRHDPDGDDFGHGPEDPDGEHASLEAKLPCQSWSLNEAPQNQKVTKLPDTLSLYASLNNRQGIRDVDLAVERQTDSSWLHDYNLDMNTGDITIRHRNCNSLGVSRPGQSGTSRVICQECWSLGNSRFLVKTLTRFATKYFAAVLLRARLFRPDDVEKVLTQLRGSDMYHAGHQAEIEAVCSMEVEVLQRFVRSTFMSVPARVQSDSFKLFLCTVVKPCVDVSSNTWNSQVIVQSEVLAKHLSNQTLRSVQDIEMKLACKVANGALRNHSMLQGLLISFLAMAERRDRGVQTMRNLQLAPRELELVAEAGAALSMAASNKQVLKMFGMAFAGGKVKMTDLHAASLPDPFMANLETEILGTNAHLIETMFRKEATAPSRRLVMAIDKTYALKSLDIVQNRLGKCWVGSAYMPNEDPEDRPGCNGYIKLREPSEEDDENDPCDMVLNTSKVTRAHEIMECLVWDPASCVKGRPRFSLCCTPMIYQTSAEQMLSLFGTILQHGGHYIRCIVT